MVFFWEPKTYGDSDNILIVPGSPPEQRKLMGSSAQN